MYLFHQILCNPALKLIGFQSVFWGGGNNTGCFCKLIQCAVTATVSSAFLKFSLWFFLEVRLIYSLVLSLKHKTNMFFQCCSVCIPAHCLLPMTQSLSKVALLPLLDSHPACWEQWVICWAGGRISQSTWLILWHWTQFHPIMEWLTSSSGTSLPCLIYMCIVLCGTFWCSFDAALRSGERGLARVSQVWFVW